MTKLLTLHPFHTESIPWKFRRNLMNQIRDIWKNPGYGSGYRNCSAHFYPFLPILGQIWPQKIFFAQKRFRTIFFDFLEFFDIFNINASREIVISRIERSDWPRAKIEITREPDFCRKKFFAKKFLPLIRFVLEHF